MLNGITSRLEHYMDLLATRQKLVSSNIANLDTPGYKTQDLDFRHEFATLAEGGVPQALEVEGLASKSDGNNVSMDREARLLAENALRFNIASNLVRSQIRMVRTAVKEGS
jgi:flagellar basal-body rod protein FlgB